MRAAWLDALFILVLLALVTWLAHAQFAVLGMATSLMLYLAVMLLAACRLPLWPALGMAVIASITINYFLIDPRYTFAVADLASWAALAGFLLLALVVTSLVRRLRQQTQQAEAARAQAELARQLADHLALCDDAQAMLRSSTALLRLHTGLPMQMLRLQLDGTLSSLEPTGEPITVNPAAVRWVMQNGKALGPGTANWPEAESSLLPLLQLPSEAPVLWLPPSTAASDWLPQLRSLLGQIGLAYQRLNTQAEARALERKAEREALHNTLLSSLSHDMRTPLTAILGASSTLLYQADALDAAAQQRLLQAIRSEALYLDDATDNILGLVRLGQADRSITLDWQSAEEIVADVLARYRQRVTTVELQAEVGSELLIRADARLLTQALANLIDNALVQHQGSAPLLIQAYRLDGRVRLAVADRGPGFPAGFSVNSIERFAQPLQPGRVRQGRGFGLGLAIVQAIAGLHQAELCITARDGGGSVVSLVFPPQTVPA
ncbi:DUF4118 domain-containing protein [Pseudomethylobacillus aquaticus]|uniref:histidine kinase n=1 Tax=Pseudomethylobacillus aquaticus TaxID=2676064 RepID=A0A3N0UVE7_9PROT|nr:DUF4118 domain-containing protein [Pseudomethylobacillus aquaticus]ROH84455.1 DUF4118 domain-containing protein [Pseudomethylobacillus aquaticus]